MSRTGSGSAAAIGASSSSSSLKSKSPAEFFAEHQNIAGFDNPGKSLYTTIREFVENSLDAAESAGVLPLIDVRVEKLSTAQFNSLRGIDTHARADLSLYEPAAKSKGKGRKPAASDASPAPSQSSAAGAVAGSAGAAAAAVAASGAGGDAGEEDDKSRPSFFRVTCRDNGSGIRHDLIPNSLGVVLSSTKYGVKQTRGKFGLGAKMALVWAKKSTGLPVEILSATSSKGDVSYCKLDIDIYKNTPSVLAHQQQANEEQWRGLEISVVIGGKWQSYQAKVLNYLKQLAVITPYAQINMEYIDAEAERKSWSAQFLRRTEVMPPPAHETKHHPSSVDNLLVEQLIHQSTQHKFKTFLTKSFSCINGPLADRLISELRGDFSSDMDVRDLDKKQIHQITALFRQAKFPMPDANVSDTILSPAGEYNLRLGIMKELSPDLVFTATHPLEIYEGHPFIVEAAVALGGKAKPGIAVYRYANRIPLLFEGGNDVASVVANTKIKWSNYKLNPRTDKLCVFVSLVSTKIPFKGTSKEYIGDDKGVLHAAVKKTITLCCQQMKKRLLALHAAKEKESRRKKMSQYIPDVARSFMTLLTSIADADGSGSSMLPPPPAKRQKLDRMTPEQHQELVDRLRIQPHEQSGLSSLLAQVKSSAVSEEVLQAKLRAHVDAKDAELAQLGEGDDGDDAGGASSKGASASAAAAAATPFFIGGMDMENIELKYLYGEDFKIAYWY